MNTCHDQGERPTPETDEAFEEFRETCDLANLENAMAAMESQRNEARKRGHDDMVAAVNNLAGDCPACIEVGFCGSYMSIVDHKGCAHAQLAEARAEVALLQMELDASCNAEELRQVREENARLRGALARIKAIENRHNGGDWDEIEEAREIAQQALTP